MNKTVQHKGFTLIELLVVISIIGILATLISANLNAARSRGRDAVRKSDLKNIQTALRLYYNDNGGYPDDLGFGEEFSSDDSVYMNTVPNDPLYNSLEATSPRYEYESDSANDAFTLVACLENKSDAKCDTNTETGELILCSIGSGCQYSVTP